MPGELWALVEPLLPKFAAQPQGGGTAYDLRRWLRHRGIIPRIARKGIESSERLGRHRWVVERTISRLTGYRRLTIHYERHADNYCGLLTLVAALTCFKRLTELAA